MNFDPYDSAAWRTFDMLDAEEAAAFDEAMHHDPVLQSAYFEMDRLAAAIATTLTAPIEPKPGQLERLQSGLGLQTSKHSHYWLTISGWSAAAVLGVLLVLHLTGIIDQWDSGSGASPAGSTPLSKSAAAPAGNGRAHNSVASLSKAADAVLAGAPAAGKEPDIKTASKVETKRLHQEVEVLRENLEQFQHRDRVLFEVVPGMALPVVMTLNPPGVGLEDPTTLAKNEEHASITAMLGDALTSLTGASGNPAADTRPTDPAVLPKHPTAIPIYDMARDSGTMVVSNLPLAGAGEVYNLWVTLETSGHPIYVGSLPESSVTGADSFDFSLGSTMVLPSGFILTKDPQEAPASPTETNTVLQGPPLPAP